MIAYLEPKRDYVVSGNRVIIACPNCGDCGSLHESSTDIVCGRVIRSMLCPHCLFCWEGVELKEWRPSGIVNSDFEMRLKEDCIE